MQTQAEAAAEALALGGRTAMWVMQTNHQAPVFRFGWRPTTQKEQGGGVTELLFVYIRTARFAHPKWTVVGL